MKELSIEQKAKRYDEALEKSKRLYEQGTITESLCYVFPELKEPEDEKAMEDLLNFLKSPFIKDNICDWKVAPWIAWIEKQGEQKTWSKEDERLLNNMVIVIQDYYNKEDAQSLISWLKSLKDRVLPQPKQEWSEEDEKIALSIEQVMNCASLLNIVPEKVDKIRTWLKFLKERIGG